MNFYNAIVVHNLMKQKFWGTDQNEAIHNKIKKKKKRQ